MPPVGFEPTVSAGERPQTYALDRATTGTGTAQTYKCLIECRINTAVSFYILLPIIRRLNFEDQ